METRPTPYHPITPEIAASGLLITIKQAAANEGCCANTLKENAKVCRLRAFQRYFGAPVLVLPSDVALFLKSRPDIGSRHYPKCTPGYPGNQLQYQTRS